MKPAFEVVARTPAMTAAAAPDPYMEFYADVIAPSQTCLTTWLIDYAAWIRRPDRGETTAPACPAEIIQGETPVHFTAKIKQTPQNMPDILYAIVSSIALSGYGVRTLKNNNSWSLAEQSPLKKGGVFYPKLQPATGPNPPQ
jgi:hypothetical protein